MSQPRRRDREEARRCSRISIVRWFANTVLGAVPTDGNAYELSKLIVAMLLPFPPAVALAQGCSPRRLYLRVGRSGPSFKTRVKYPTADGVAGPSAGCRGLKARSHAA